jgi:DNA modification methylase
MRIMNDLLEAKSVAPSIVEGVESYDPKSIFSDHRAANVDWNFSHRTTGDQLESIHPYPAKFIREIPSTLIDIFAPPKGTAVFDPFCGSGTTLVEAQRRNLPVIGVDLNPIACLMSRVKTGKNLNGLAQTAEEIARSLDWSDAIIPPIPNIDHWFDLNVQKVLSKLSSCLITADPPLRDGLRLALSSILVRVSKQESDTRYAAIDKRVSPENVLDGFKAAAEKLEVALESRPSLRSPVIVLERDALSLTEQDFIEPVGLVVTSPPYPNAYEYWLYHKYRMFWLGFDPIAVKALEIGARAHFFKKNHHTAERFGEQMTILLRLLERITVPNAYVCIVVGRSIIHGKTIDNAKNIERIATQMSFTSEFVTERRIAATRKSFNLSHANIKTETVLVLRRK